jgi:hypothetical protein
VLLLVIPLVNLVRDPVRREVDVASNANCGAYGKTTDAV